MSQAPRLGRAGAMTGLLSVIALSCSSDIVELLPLTAGASNGGGGGSAGQDAVASGASTGGGNAGGSPMSQGGWAGAAQAGGGNGGSAGLGCFGFGCAGENGFSGAFGGPNCGNGTGACTPCLNDDQCPLEQQHCSSLLNNVCVQCTIKGSSQCNSGYNCDVLAGRCAPSCDSTFDCNDNRVCDLNQGTCVSCIDNRECENDGDPRTSVCYLRHCVECAQHSDCMRPGSEQRWCSKFQCVQCLADKDCGFDGKTHCDVPKGFCE
jgi:hypothetical protein